MSRENLTPVRLQLPASGTELTTGTYIPNIADVIFKHNTALELAPTPSLPVLNFKSVLIGLVFFLVLVYEFSANGSNGLTDPYEQFGSVPE
jgi:cathepsin A (carboxypeptidase C)